MRITKFISVSLALLVSSCVIDNDTDFPFNNCLDGQGAIISESRTVDDFHSITNLIYADLLLTQGPKEDIIVEAQQNILREIKASVVNGELRLSSSRCVDIDQPVKVFITNPEIRSLSLTGVGDIVAQNDFDLNNLSLYLYGVGDFILRGTTANLDMLISGVGDVRAFELSSDICDVTITGTGDAEVLVNDELNVTISGTGTVYYKGNPAISTSISGLGSVVDSN